MNKNDKKLFILANELLGDVAGDIIKAGKLNARN